MPANNTRIAYSKLQAFDLRFSIDLGISNVAGCADNLSVFL
jgi:hypothetical protein